MRTVKKISFLIAILLCFTVMIAALGSCSKEEITYGKGRFIFVEGDARIHRRGGSLPAYKGADLRNGDVLSTDKDTTAMIAFDGAKYVVVEAESKVSFEIYTDSLGRTVRMTLHSGAIYTEADNSLEEGESYVIRTADVEVSGGGAVYRVEVDESSNHTRRHNRVNAIKGKIEVELLDGVGEKKELSDWSECIVKCSKTKDSVPYYSEFGSRTDPYTLPDRYVDLGADGVFDAEGNIIPKVKSSDNSLKGIKVVNADGVEKPLIPEFSNEENNYVVECAGFSGITFTATHRKAQIKLIALGNTGVELKGNVATASFSISPEEVDVFVIIADIIAEDGSERRVSVTVITYEEPIDENA
ncbi:MAG: hypothetical protein IJY04_01920 [Clostridia bacterium]|nr:hypothetical protein [Clostridia bacterium]